MSRVIHVDLGRCIYCRACEVACGREHDGVSRMFVQLIDECYAAPMNCRHCETSPCTIICPTQAVHRETQDIVSIDAMKCIGCCLCQIACPFGAIRLDLANKVSRKCDLCIHRVSRGLDPACVTTCSARALYFGEFEEIIAKARQKTAVTLISRAAGEVGTLVTLPANSYQGSAYKAKPR
jgi:formate dehydrogenase iron-sulfur subunit